MSGALWLAILGLGAAVYAARALPFLWPAPPADRPASAWLGALGPCLLAAMAVAVLVPEARGAWAAGTARPALAGAAATLAMMVWRRDAGLATLVGVAAYALAA